MAVGSVHAEVPVPPALNAARRLDGSKPVPARRPGYSSEIYSETTSDCERMGLGLCNEAKGLTSQEHALSQVTRSERSQTPRPNLDLQILCG